MSPELRLLLAGLLTGSLLTVSLEVALALWWTGRQADVELYGVEVPAPSPCPPTPPRRRR